MFVKRTLYEWQLLLQSYPEEEIVETALDLAKEDSEHGEFLVELCETGLMTHEAMNQMLLAFVAVRDPSAIVDYSEKLHQGLIIRRGPRLPHQIRKGEKKRRRQIITISDEEFPKPVSFKLSVEDVWGKVEGNRKISNGMVVARSNEQCPYFLDVVPFKSVTVLCNVDQFPEVCYWLQQVHGSRCITHVRSVMEGRKLAIRSESQHL